MADITRIAEIREYIWNLHRLDKPENWPDELRMLADLLTALDAATARAEAAEVDQRKLDAVVGYLCIADTDIEPVDRVKEVCENGAANFARAESAERRVAELEAKLLPASDEVLRAVALAGCSDSMCNCAKGPGTHVTCYHWARRAWEAGMKAEMGETK